MHKLCACFYTPCTISERKIALFILEASEIIRYLKNIKNTVEKTWKPTKVIRFRTSLRLLSKNSKKKDLGVNYVGILFIFWKSLYIHTNRMFNTITGCSINLAIFFFKKAATPNCLACGELHDYVHLFCECKDCLECFLIIMVQLLIFNSWTWC